MCEQPAVNSGDSATLFFGCEKHIQKALQRTKSELNTISRIGFVKWLRKGKPKNNNHQTEKP